MGEERCLCGAVEDVPVRGLKLPGDPAAQVLRQAERPEGTVRGENSKSLCVGM